MAGVNKIEIYQVEVKPEEAGTYCIKVFWKTQETPQPYSGTYHVEVNSLGSVVASTDSSQKNASLSGVTLDLQTLYNLSVSADGKTDTVPLLIATYEQVMAQYDGEVLKISWNAPNNRINGGRCIVSVSQGGSFSYDIPAYVRGMEIPLKESIYGQNCVLSAIIQPFVTKISMGPSVTLSEIYRSRYIVSPLEDGTVQICYKDKNPEEAKVAIPLDGEIFAADAQGGSKKPDAPVVAGPLELGVTAPYTLSIDTGTCLQRSDYDSFVASLLKLVTPKAFYDILESITRCALHNTQDSLYLHCGLRLAGSATDSNGNQRCADVRPGFTLRVEQEHYMPKEQLNGEDAAGFVGTHTAEYMVSLTDGDNTQYLEFDSFISGMEEDVCSSTGQSSQMLVAGGVIDLCAVRMRSSFYRIQYPAELYSSDVEPDIYPENHTLLVPSHGWVETSQWDNYVLFRGRSALTLLVTVVVNGIEKKVPVGTTFGKLLNAMGIYGTRKNEMTWYRRSPFGVEVPLYFTGDIIADMPLLHGDRIEG